MKKITGQDLRERLVHLKNVREADGLGGWKENWVPGEGLWAGIQPLVGRDGFHPDDLGGGMASQVGFLKSLPPARYRIVLRAPFKGTPEDRFEWMRGGTRCVLRPTSQPYFVQNKAFVCISAVEGQEEHHG